MGQAFESMTCVAMVIAAFERWHACGLRLPPRAPAAVVLALTLAGGTGCRKSDSAPPQSEAKIPTTAPLMPTPALGVGGQDSNLVAGSSPAQSLPPQSLTPTNIPALVTLAADPDELMRWHQSGSDLIQRRRFEEAISVFQKVLQKKADDEEAHFNLGFCFARLTQMDQALHHYSEAIRILPEYAEAHNNLGNLLARQGHVDKAMEHFKAAILNSPENASAHNNLGTTLVRIGRIQEAIPSFEEASRLNTNYVEAHYNLGRAYQTQGRFQEAIRQYERAVQIDPSFEYGKSALKKVLDQRKIAP